MQAESKIREWSTKKAFQCKVETVSMAMKVFFVLIKVMAIQLYPTMASMIISLAMQIKRKKFTHSQTHATLNLDSPGPILNYKSMSKIQREKGESRLSLLD